MDLGGQDVLGGSLGRLISYHAKRVAYPPPRRLCTMSTLQTMTSRPAAARRRLYTTQGLRSSRASHVLTPLLSMASFQSLSRLQGTNSSLHRESLAEDFPGEGRPDADTLRRCEDIAGRCSPTHCH